MYVALSVEWEGWKVERRYEEKTMSPLLFWSIYVATACFFKHWQNSYLGLTGPKKDEGWKCKGNYVFSYFLRIIFYSCDWRIGLRASESADGFPTFAVSPSCSPNLSPLIFSMWGIAAIWRLRKRSQQGVGTLSTYACSLMAMSWRREWSFNGEAAVDRYFYIIIS
jgi:hypothetical protein